MIGHYSSPHMNHENMKDPGMRKVQDLNNFHQTR